MKDLLTIILPIYDRPYFTKRWLSYANDTCFPFKILVADGGKGSSIENYLRERSHYPKLDYEYLRFPYDDSYLQYWKKIVSTLEKVKTPYVVMADDDDIYSLSGLQESVNFLNSNPGYNICRGSIGTFSTKYHINHSVKFQLKNESSIEDDAALNRVNHLFNNFVTTFYDIHRTKILLSYFRKIVDAKITSLAIMEFMLAFMAAADGKIKRGHYLYLIREAGHMQSTSQKGRDHCDRFMRDSWSYDFHVFINAVADKIVENDKVEKSEVESIIKSGYKRMLTPLIINQLLTANRLSFKQIVAIIRAWIVERINYAQKIGLVFRKLYHRYKWFQFDKKAWKAVKKSEKELHELETIHSFLNQYPSDKD